MHAASRWLPAALGMLLLVLPSAESTLGAAPQSRNIPETSRRIYQKPAPLPEAKQQIPICIVPQLSDVDDVKREQAAKRLTLGTVHKVETDRGPVGTILKQSPSPGSKVRCGQEVEIWVVVAPKPKPEPPKPDPPKPDPPKPDPRRPDYPKPDHVKPDYPKPDPPKPDYPRPDPKAGSTETGLPETGPAEAGLSETGLPKAGSRQA